MMNLELLHKLGVPQDVKFCEWPKHEYALLEFGEQMGLEIGYVSLERMMSKGSISFSPAVAKRIPPKSTNVVMLFDCKNYKPVLVTKYFGLDALLVESTTRSWFISAKQLVYALNEAKIRLTDEMMAAVYRSNSQPARIVG